MNSAGLTTRLLIALIGTSLIGTTPVLAKGEQYCSTRSSDCATLIVPTVNRARHELFAQAHDFTAGAIVDALVKAKARGVDVRVILHRKGIREANWDVRTLAGHHIPTLLDGTDPPSLARTMVIDGLTVITGSVNFTMTPEERQKEDVVVYRDKKAAATYRDLWMKAAIAAFAVK